MVKRNLFIGFCGVLYISTMAHEGKLCVCVIRGELKAISTWAERRCSLKYTFEKNVFKSSQPRVQNKGFMGEGSQRS